MIEQLIQLGFTTKEAKVYLALLEFGTQPASVIAKKTSYPKSTVLFLFEGLLKRGFIRKSRRGRVQYFYADPDELYQQKKSELQIQQEQLETTVPLLKEFKNPFTSPPKLQFFEGVVGCRKAYSLLLESKTEICEFAAHTDLIKMGVEFMEKFVVERSRRKILIRTVSKISPINKDFLKKNKKQHRELFLYDPKIGELYSSIDVFEDKVLLLNLYHDAFAILIENKEVAETLKTIHRLVWS